MAAPRITKEEVKRKLDMKEDFVLLDVRNQTDYDTSTVSSTHTGRRARKKALRA